MLRLMMVVTVVRDTNFCSGPLSGMQPDLDKDEPIRRSWAVRVRKGPFWQRASGTRGGERDRRSLSLPPAWLHFKETRASLWLCASRLVWLFLQPRYLLTFLVTCTWPVEGEVRLSRLVPSLGDVKTNMSEPFSRLILSRMR